MKTYKESPSAPRLLELHEIQGLLDEVPQHLRALVSVVVHAGLRSAEIYRLQWRDIEWVPAELAGAAQMDRWLLEYCQQRQTGAVPRRDIQRLVTPATLRRKDAFCAALRELAEAGRIREVATGSHKVVQVNPLLLGGGTE